MRSRGSGAQQEGLLEGLLEGLPYDIEGLLKIFDFETDVQKRVFKLCGHHKT